MATDSTPKTLQQAILFFSDYENCKRAVMAIRWADGTVRCPRCGSEKVTYLENARLWKCYGDHPKAKFSLKVGTIFEDSPIGLEKWLPALWLVTNCKNGISSYELGRALGVTQKTAWFMLSRLRLALQDGVSGGKLGGDVEADETFIGGKARNMHKGKRTRLGMRRGRPMVGKVAVTYVSVEPFHLFRYLDEQAFRFNNRASTDAIRFSLALKGIIGKRLTYTALTGSELPQTC